MCWLKNNGTTYLAKAYPSNLSKDDMLNKHKHLSSIEDQAVLSPQPIDDIQYNVKTGS